MTTDKSELLDKMPPRNLEAERSVLGSMLLDQRCIDDVVLEVREAEFYNHANQKLFKHITEMHDKGGRVDTTLLTAQLKRAGDLEAVGGVAYLAEVMQSVAVAAHAIHYAKLVHKEATLRSLIHVSTEILRDAYDPTSEPGEILDRAEEKLFAVRDVSTESRVAPIVDVLVEAMAAIDRQADGSATGIATGFRELDELTGGLRKSELIILASRPSMGKTALAMNIAEHVSMKLGVLTLFVSLEMARGELGQRMLCGLSSVDGHKIQRGTLSATDQRDLIESSSLLSQAPLHIDDSPTQSVSEIAANCRRLARKEPLGLVVVDYLQLIQPSNRRDPRHEQIGEITRRLKALARELGIAVLCLAQLNREVEASGSKRPNLSHLRESGSIEQDADVVMFVHRPEYFMDGNEIEKKRAKGKAEIIVKKNRNGPTGGVHLTWEAEYVRFTTPVVQEPYDEFTQYGGDF